MAGREDQEVQWGASISEDEELNPDGVHSTEFRSILLRSNVQALHSKTQLKPRSIWEPRERSPIQSRVTVACVSKTRQPILRLDRNKCSIEVRAGIAITEEEDPGIEERE